MLNFIAASVSQIANTAGTMGYVTIAPANGLTNGGFGERVSMGNPMRRWRARSFNLNLGSGFSRNITKQDDRKVPMTVKAGGLAAYDTEDNPSFDITITQGFNSLAIAEPNYGDSPENIYYSIGAITGWDTDADNQKQQPPYVYDAELLDPQVEKITLPIEAWDYEIDHQTQQLPYNLDKDVSDVATEKITIPVNVWDSVDIENQRQQDPYILDEDLSDTGTEKITLPSPAWDTDADNQLSHVQLNPLSYNYQYVDDDWEWAALSPVSSATDIILMSYYGYSIIQAGKEEVPGLAIPIVQLILGWDTDSENQNLQQPWTTDRDLSDAGVEKITIAVIPVVAYDTDADYQSQWNPWFQSDDVLDAGIELITLPAPAWDTDEFQQLHQIQLNPLSYNYQYVDEDGEWFNISPNISFTDIILMGYYGYNALQGTKEESAWTQFIVPVTQISDFTWDYDGENQLQQLDWYRDLIEERHQLPIIPIVAYDTDADNQKLQDNYITDRDLSDTSVEKITIPVNEWSTDADQQRLNPLPFGADTVSDEGIEVIILPPVVTTTTWDDFSEQSFQQLGYYKDHIPDETVEKITLPVTGWDHDTDNQLAQLPYVLDRDVFDTGVELITLPFNDWTHDSDYQLQQLSYFLDGELSEEAVEFYIAPTGWDNDAEQQIPGLAFTTDRDTTDTGVESIQYSIGVIRGWDTDSDLQLQQLGYNQDGDSSDTGVERIVIPINEWDTDSEYQFLNPLNFNADPVSDEGVEKITLPPLSITNVYDDLIENSLRQLLYLSDDVMDNIELLITPPFIDIVEILGEEEE